MFDIGFGEIFLIAIVALLVLGPERLPKAARFAGLWMRRARAQWYSVKAELENELADDDLRRSLKQTQADLLEARDSLAQSGAALKQQVEQAGAEVRGAFESETGSDNARIDSGESDHEQPLSSVMDEWEQPELLPDDDDAEAGDTVRRREAEADDIQHEHRDNRSGEALSESAVHPDDSGQDARHPDARR
ncbi:Sec-independent protein translocase protein TatB [Lysobacter sp. Root494]|uniref:Sec-independent protein translocase protein TatB n=1 Tax=Lysobacter sp. Root494 TaxID=1736549 RepID=UPI0009EC2DBB